MTYDLGQDLANYPAKLLRYVLTDTAGVLCTVHGLNVWPFNLCANRTKMEAENCPTLNMNAMHNYP